MDAEQIQHKYLDIRSKLLAEQNDEGYWTGELATSALSTAVAIVALKKYQAKEDQSLVSAGVNWLCQNMNADGGYGDTVNSISNVTTTLLCYAALKFCGNEDTHLREYKAMENWLAKKGIKLDPDVVTTSIMKFYGNDYTFSIPILSMLTICGVLPVSCLNRIPGLPYELSLLPSSMYRFFNLRVVSYALPALIAVGIYLQEHRTKKIPGISKVRQQFMKPAIRKLDRLVPESGGFLEAIPLTGFVVMCLVCCRQEHTSIVSKGIQFLRNQIRKNGSWPIDTDLSTWVTTLSVKALGADVRKTLTKPQVDQLRTHLLKLQYKTVHPFNGARPGGWGWTSFAGSVPDADDTPGAMLTLLELWEGSPEETEAIVNGCRWLTGVQNSDGGFPTFCKGWGRLPFDRSCADLTGHALLALCKASDVLQGSISASERNTLYRSISRAIHFLKKHQTPDGAWLPLWFGNQGTPDQTNPVYGTAKVCIYLSDCLSTGHQLSGVLSPMIMQAQKYLLSQQNIDGSWGGLKGVEGTIEETALAVSALSGVEQEACTRGLEWLGSHESKSPAPIGLYFSLLWYYEKLYPKIYYTEALRRFIIK